MKKISILLITILLFIPLTLIGTNSQAIAVTDDKKVEDGIYKIVLAEDQTKSVTIANGSTGNSANVQINKYEGMPYQEFKLVSDGQGYYEIIAVNSEKRLDMCGWGNGTNIEQWSKNPSSDSQKWKIQKNEKGNYNIISQRQGLYLTAHNSNLTDGTNIEAFEKNGGSGQEFILEKVEKIEEGTYKIGLANSPTQCVTVDSIDEKDGANVNIQKYANKRQQQFKIKYNSQGYVEIISLYSEKRLDVCGWGNGVNIEQWGENITSDSQKWVIKKNANGKYNIISQRGFLYLTAHNSNSSDGTNIEGFEKNGGSGQEFILEKVKNEKIVPKKTIEDGIYKISMASHESQSVSIAGGSIENSSNVEINYYQDLPYQEFKFVSDGQGYYEIIATNSGKRLDVCGWGNGVNIEQWSENKNTDSQKWIVYKNAEGNYNIISKRQNLYLTVHNSNYTNGTNIEGYEKNNRNGQEFSLEKVEKLEEGKYTISLASSPTQSVSIKDGSNENSANVNIQKYIKRRYQQFEIKYNSQGYAEIISISSKKRLDVCGWGNGTNVEQWDENQPSDSQKWIIKKNANGNYNIISRRGHLYLTAHNSNSADGTNIEVYEKNGGSGQEFKIEKVEEDKIEPKKTIEEGTYKIESIANSNKGISIDSGSTNNGANVHLWDLNNCPEQEFNFVYDGQGYYEIIPVNSGKRLDMCGWGNETNVAQWSKNTDTDSQKWIIYQNSDGYYNIIAKRQWLYLTLHNSNSENGTNVEVYEKRDDNSQNFNLKKISNKSEKLVENGKYQIQSRSNSNIVLEVAGGDQNSNGRVQVWQNYYTRWQKIKLEYENGYYKIMLGHSGKYLTAKNGKIQSGSEITQDDWKNTESQKWGIRDFGNGSIGIYSLANYDLMLNIKNKIENGSVIELKDNTGSSNQLFCFTNTTWVEIDNSKYPGIQETIDNLMCEHPNWEFEILYTGIDFNEAVKAEYEGSNKQKSLIDTNTYKCDWISEDPYVSGRWASASYNAVQYFMDARNFLNDSNVLQFQDLANYWESGATFDSIQYQVNNTFLQNYTNDVMEACKRTNINPYYILARLFQEQGSSGSGTIDMDGGDGKRYFNPFNIGARVGNDVQTALERAKREGWDSMEKGLEGGINIIKERYINKQQNTLYLNKFDVNPVSGGALYENQYMQNISAAYSEANTMKKPYEQTGTFNNKKKFIIPVYENMPSTPSAKPTGTGKNPLAEIKGPKSVKVVTNGSNLKLRDTSSTKGNILEELPSGTVLLSVERLSNRWQKVVTPSGKKGYCSGEYLQTIEDQTNCYDTMYINSDDVNIRIGPGREYDSITKKSTGTKVTRIVTNKYFYNNLCWDEIILPDGTKGFVANKYLSY